MGVINMDTAMWSLQDGHATGCDSMRHFSEVGAQVSVHIPDHNPVNTFEFTHT